MSDPNLTLRRDMAVASTKEASSEIQEQPHPLSHRIKDYSDIPECVRKDALHPTASALNRDAFLERCA